MVAVDTYMKTNRQGHYETEYRDNRSIDQVISWEDFDAAFGITHDSFDDLDNRHQAYRLMAKFPEKVNIIFRCGHAGPKERHHPDYNKPFDVELLCIHCHHARHAEARERFNQPMYHRRIVAVVPPSNPSLTATTDSDRGTLCVTPKLDRSTGGIEDDPTPLEADSDDSDIPYTIGGSCSPSTTGWGVQLAFGF